MLTLVDVLLISLTQYAPVWELVPDAELARLTRLRRNHDRNASALALTVVRLAASEATGCPVESVVIDRRCRRCGSGDHGPMSLTAPGRVMPHVSVSHSDHLVMVALCPSAPVGVDLELINNLEPDDDLAAVLLPDQQLPAYGSASAHVRSEMLARQWTRKEAVSKAVGVGLAVPLIDLKLTDSTLWRPAPSSSAALVGSVDKGHRAR